MAGDITSCRNVLLSSIGASIGVIVITQYTLTIMFVDVPRSQSSATSIKHHPSLSPSFNLHVTVPVLNASASALDPQRSLRPPSRQLGSLHDLAASWTAVARLLSTLRRRVLEYFNPGRVQATFIDRPKPLCPLPGIRPSSIAARRIRLSSRLL